MVGNAKSQPRLTSKFVEVFEMNTGSNIIKLVRTRVFSKFNNVINKSFSDKYLFYTNMGISLALSGVGDIIEQNYEMFTNEIDSWDKTRTRNMSIYGLTVGAMCHHWYIFLDRKLPGYTLQTVMKKLIWDQIVCSPVTILTLFVTTGLLEGKSRREVLTEINEKAWILYTAEWVVWPVAQFINFYFLPTKYRVLYDNTISLGYDIYTSCIKHSKTKSKEN